MGFESPNYTQVPNDFFDMIPDMGEAELRATLVMIRQTFGYHRDSFKMGINKLKDAAGLSRNGAKDGAEAAEKRGNFKRVNPEAQTEAEWELSVDQPETRSPSDQGVGHPVTTPPSPSDQQVRVKERIKKVINKAPTANKYPTFSQNVLDNRQKLLMLKERISAEINVDPNLKDKKWVAALQEILKREEKGQTFDVYAKWFRAGNDYNRPKPHQIGMNPNLLINTWGQAFVAIVAKANNPEPEYMADLRRRAEKQSV